MLEKGTRLGPYEIVSPLGAGGMGEVYRARDARLGRDVAVKVLSSRFSDGSDDARARFEREARTVSQLNHPHICTLHDVGREGRIDYLVMELLEGETLAARIARGSIPIPEILIFAEQIAGALAKAHAAGVVHRDLKPGNMMVTGSSVKLLDFGLARPAESAVDISQSPTASASLTREGAVVGTFGYMAPEQLEGKATDARTDLFAFGCVLYEMTTGRRAFGGTSLISTMSAVSSTVPDPPSRVDARVPRALDRIIGRCLEKDPAKRYASASEVADELARLRRWVREEALPELARIVDRVQVLDEGPDPWAGFELVREIEKLVPDEPLLAQLREGCTRVITIDSDPPGAEVFASYYANPEGPFVSFGRTPVRASYPRGFTRVRLELAGRRTVHDVIWNFEVAVVSGSTDASATLWRYELPKSEEVPEEMEPVPGGKSILQLPGLDHLAPEPMVPFHMDRHPVTNREFKAFVDAGGYANEALWTERFVEGGRELSREEAMSRFTDALGRPGPAAWELGEFPAGEDDFPVSGVSWFEAAAYAAWAEKELPTIFHFNRAAFTVGASQFVSFANFSGRGPVRVGSTGCVHRFGIHDLAGNVREWCRNATSTGERYILGGGWNDPEYALSDGYAQSAFDRSATNGFRCVRSSAPEPNAANLERAVELPFRDYYAEKPVSDEIFAFFARQFHYDKTPLDVVEEPVVEGPLGPQQIVRFTAGYGGERMSAHLYLPSKGRPPYQTVVLFPGSSAIRAVKVGATELRRIDFLMKSGRAVLMPVYKGTYDRPSETLKSDNAENASWYRDHVVMWAKDLARAIDFIEQRRDLDATKIAYYGLSWGGQLGALLPAIEPRIKASVLYVAGLPLQSAPAEVDYINYVTRVKQPTLMLNGALDFFFPLETSQRPMFDLLGTPPEHKKWVTYPRGHSVPRTEMVKETLAWLDRYLGPTAG